MRTLLLSRASYTVAIYIYMYNNGIHIHFDVAHESLYVHLVVVELFYATDRRMSIEMQTERLQLRKMQQIEYEQSSVHEGQIQHQMQC